MLRVFLFDLCSRLLEILLNATIAGLENEKGFTEGF